MQLPVAMGLQTYWQKRDFERTAEPRGQQSRRTGHAFVVQKHDARNLHYDFRLELDGVLLSWAVPKGPSLDPQVKRLAMQTEDHPLDYGEFEGVIPQGEYGGGAVLLWDRGTWEPEGDPEEMYRRGRLNFTLHGEKLHGGFHLVRTGPADTSGKQRWLLFKSKDDAAKPGTDDGVLKDEPRSVISGRDIASVAEDPDHVWTSKEVASTSSSRKKTQPRTKAARAPDSGAELAGNPSARRLALPQFVEPELATLSAEAPEGSDWLSEIKLDGYRILARLEGHHAQLLSRRGNDWTSRLPSIASALGRLPIASGLLDGEVVVLRDDGVSDFQRLQNSMEAGRDRDCVYFAFDALFLDGFDVRRLPLRERKARLKAALEQTANPRVRFSDHVAGDGPAFFTRACKLGLEGIVCKRADSAYTSGRGRSWLKVKCLSRQEFVIGGFTEPAGSRRHLGALLVGVRENGGLTYAGKVGTGYTQASLAELARRLGPLEQKEPPFQNPPTGAERRGVHWVQPRLVAEIAFVERTQDGLVRHASFQGLREDKAPEDVHLETPAGTADETDAASRSTGKAKAKATKRAGKVKAAAKAEANAKSKYPVQAETAAKVKSPAKAEATAKAEAPAKRKPAAKAEASAKVMSPVRPEAAAKRKPAVKAEAPAKGRPPAKAERVPTTARAGGVATSKASRPKAPLPQPVDLDPSRVEITHPDRILFPDQGITKRDLMLHYARVARWMLPQIVDRPLMLVRCPEGAGKQCFHQKHPSRGMPRAVQQVTVQQKKGPEENLMIRDVEGLLGLVQMGALEIHAWGCRKSRLDCPDQLVFDLDPDEELPWERVVEAALTLRERLDEHGLAGFVRVTGGKGLHIVTPVIPTTPWEAAKRFTKRVADAIVQAEPTKYLATMTKQKRKGKLFIDYFRNGVGATAVCSYSTRARSGAPLALPIDWDELEHGVRPDQFTVQNLQARLGDFVDPWSSFDEARAPIPT